MHTREPMLSCAHIVVHGKQYFVLNVKVDMKEGEEGGLEKQGGIFNRKKKYGWVAKGKLIYLLFTDQIYSTNSLARHWYIAFE